jgi:hypothetical protein
MGTMNRADVYGEMGPTYQIASPISAPGPWQSYVNPGFTGPQTGALAAPGGKAPALSLIGLAVGLVILRVLIELGGEA